MDYVGKWVAVYSSPNNQNSRIGRIKCLFITMQTEKTVYGSEDKTRKHWVNKAPISSIIRVVNEEEKDFILNTQMVTRNACRATIDRIRDSYANELELIAGGERKTPFIFENEDQPDKITQKHCPFDGALGVLTNIEIYRPIGIKFTWMCQKCHSTFTSTISYLEILNM